MRSRTARAAAVLLVAVAFATGAALVVPGITLSLALALPATASWLRQVRQDFVRETVAVRAGDHTLEADLYRPARIRGAILLVHGLSRAGRRQPDLERLATLLAREGQLVMVPDIAGLKAFHLGGSEVDDIRAALAYLSARNQRAAVAGFSFGAGPALLAADGVPGLRFAASFGGYADLRNVIRFITTGRHAIGERRYAQPSLDYNRWKLLALLAGFVSDHGDRRALEQIAERKLANPGDDTAALERALGDEGQALLALALNRRDEAVPGLIEALPAAARAALDRLSPVRAIGRLPGRILIAHGEADDSIPFTESLRLAAATGSRARVSVLHTFHHTGPRGLWLDLWPRAQDGWSLIRIAGELLTP